VADDERKLVWEDRRRLREAIDDDLADALDWCDESGAAHELNCAAPFRSLIADLDRARDCTMALILHPDATEANREKARAEFREMHAATAAQIRCELEKIEPNLDRILSPH
jgi:hypothetical protein